MATALQPPVFINSPSLRSTLTYKTLITHLQNSLPSSTPITHSPLRQTHQTSPSSSLLLMPSWSLSPSLPYIGVKIVTHHPHNSSLNLPGIQATYVLFNSLTGQTLASLDGTELTLYRTACISALASTYLSRQDSEVLVMIGAGSLAPHLIKAHLTVRPSLKRVIIWNRNIDKASSLVDKIKPIEGVSFECIGFSESTMPFAKTKLRPSLEKVVALGDIVTCATNSEEPLVMGARLKKGAHLDLVGSFKASMKECDDVAIQRGRVYVDNEAALEEAGELVGAFERGVISREEIRGNLAELIRGDKVGRRDSEEITVFKSVGSAVVDLLSAQLVYETYMNNQVVDNPPH